MHKKAITRQSAFRSASIRAACLCLFFTMALVSGVHFSSGQSIKATVLSSTLRPLTLSQWSRALDYKQPNLYSLRIGSLGCPLIDVEIAGVTVPLMLDTGMSRGFMITNHAPEIPHKVGERGEQLNPDGSHRGESYGISVNTISIFGKSFKDVNGTLADWRMFSSEPFNGGIGLDFFLDRRITFDYHARQVGVTTATLPKKLDPKHLIVLDLIDPPKSQGRILYTRALVNHREAIVYFDTGCNVSFIDPAFTEGLVRIERPGKFSVFRKAVPVKLREHTFMLDELREDPIRRGTGFDLPVALTIGSDILSRFVVTIDLRSKKMLVGLAE